MSDLKLDQILKKGSKDGQVTLIQEWLCLHGYHISIDGDFGPASDRAIRMFQEKNGLVVDGIVGNNTFSLLIKPMTNVLKEIPAGGSLNDMVIAYANQHLKEHPVEIGGQNIGPWVRLYMDGNEGKNWPWCAGFVSFVLKQACKSLNVAVPISTSYSCDLLAQSAKQKDLFVSEESLGNKEDLKPGSIFLVRKTANDWVHTGIVTGVDQDVYYTIEGNTNDEGSREGYEVCARIRGYKKKDFIAVS